MLAQLFLENSDEANQFLTWMLPRVNYKALINRLKYAESGSKVVLFDYFYPKEIGKNPVFVDMIPQGTTIHELLTNDSSVKHVMDKLFCVVDGMQWYTRRKILRNGPTPAEAANVRQVVLVVESKPPQLNISEIKEEDSMPELILQTMENFYLNQNHE